MKYAQCFFLNSYDTPANPLRTALRFSQINLVFYFNFAIFLLSSNLTRLIKPESSKLLETTKTKQSALAVGLSSA